MVWKQQGVWPAICQNLWPHASDVHTNQKGTRTSLIHSTARTPPKPPVSSFSNDGSWFSQTRKPHSPISTMPVAIADN